mgnify:CR=1 FL=1
MELNRNSIVKYKGGKKYTLTELAGMAGVDPLNNEQVMALANILLKRGDITIIDERSKFEKNMDSVAQEEIFNSFVESIDKEEEYNQDRIRKTNLENNGSHTFSLDFITTLDATHFKNWINSLGIKEVAIITDDNNAIKLYVQNVTPQEYTKIVTRYKAENVIHNTMNITNKAVNNTTNAVNYGLTNVIAPTAKIVGEAGMNIGKGLFHTGLKTMAGLINSGAKAVVDTKIALATDPECLRAQNQLIETKNALKRTINSRINNSNYGSGITNY